VNFLDEASMTLLVFPK